MFKISFFLVIFYLVYFYFPFLLIKPFFLARAALGDNFKANVLKLPLPCNI